MRAQTATPAPGNPDAVGKPASTPIKDVLIFTNGDQLTGSLTRVANGSVLFHSDMAGDLNVPMAKVKELHTAGNFALLRHGAPVAESRHVEAGAVAVTQDEVQVTPPGKAAASPVPVKDVAYLIDEKTYRSELVNRIEPWQGWNGTVTLGATLVQSTQHGGTLTAGIGLVRQVPVLTFFAPRSKTSVNVQETYGILTTPAVPASVVSGVTQPAVAESAVKTSIFHTDAERDGYLTKRQFLFGTTSFDHNFSQGLDLQQIYGMGYGWTPFNTGLHQLDLKVDAHYERQVFFDETTGLSEPAQTKNLFGSTLTETYRRTLPHRIALTQSLSVLPAWNQLSAYAADGSLGFVLPVFKRLSVSLTSTDSYLNLPAVGARKNSFQFVTGMTYTLR